MVTECFSQLLCSPLLTSWPLVFCCTQEPFLPINLTFSYYRNQLTKSWCLSGFWSLLYLIILVLRLPQIGPMGDLSFKGYQFFSQRTSFLLVITEGAKLTLRLLYLRLGVGYVTGKLFPLVGSGVKVQDTSYWRSLLPGCLSGEIQEVRGGNVHIHGHTTCMKCTHPLETAFAPQQFNKSPHSTVACVTLFPLRGPRHLASSVRSPLTHLG